MKKKFKFMVRNTLLLTGIVTLNSIFFACEDTINPDLDDSPPRMVVDAWINNKSETQMVELNFSQPYFDNGTPNPLTGATVRVIENENTTYNFEDQGDGTYTWTPQPGEVFGSIGSSFELIIESGGKTYTAFSAMGPVPTVDSITYTLEEANGIFDERIVAEFWSRDLPGQGNTYWIRTTWNGIPLNKPEELNIAWDAAFSEGGSIDGLIFIPPIREGVTPDDIEDENGDQVGALKDGDLLEVEIHSITQDAFQFLTEVSVQTNRPGGFGELFAQPLANVPSNIVSSDPGTEVLGFFNVAAVEGNSRILLEDIVRRE